MQSVLQLMMMMTLVLLNGLGLEYKPFQTSINVHETFPPFHDLIALLISEEIRLGNTGSSSQSDEQVLLQEG